jgi:hypothetical protein
MTNVATQFKGLLDGANTLTQKITTGQIFSWKVTKYHTTAANIRNRDTRFVFMNYWLCSTVLLAWEFVIRWLAKPLHGCSNVRRHCCAFFFAIVHNHIENGH